MKSIGVWLFGLVLAAHVAAVQAAPFAYIPESSGNVTVIDVETLAVVARIALGGLPFGIAVNPGGRRAYVTNATRAEVSVIDTAAQVVVENIAVPADPLGIAVNPAGTRVFVVHDTVGAPASSLTVINAENDQIVTSTPLGAGARRLAMNPLGTRLFASNTRGNSVSVIDSATYAILATIATADGPQGMVVDPAGQRLYVAHFGNTTPGDSVSVIDLGTNTVLGFVRVGARPDSLAINPSGTRVFATNRTSNSVSIIDTGSLSVTATVPVGSSPSGIDITPLADFVYVANSDSSSVSILHAEVPSVFHTLSVGSGPSAIGRFFGGTTPLAAQIPGVLSGLWWNPAESGWGIHLTQRRNIVFAAWFTYDAAGAPHWYVSSNCSMSPPLTCPDCVDNAFCSGSLFEVNGPRFFRDRFDPAVVQTTTVGVLQLEFRNRDNAMMSYVVGSQTRTVAIRRQVFQAGSTPVATDYTDLWWNPSESGWGLGITQQFGIMFLTWFVYEDTGRPIWYVASNCAVNAAGNGCRGTLYRTSGPPGPIARNTFDTSQVRVNAVGTIDVAFTDSNNAVISYSVDNVSGSKTITRQIF